MSEQVVVNKPNRIFLISYEFCFSTYSGNGILARSLVKSLLQQGCQVTVWCARPPPCDGLGSNGKDHPIEVPEVSHDEKNRLSVLYTTISRRSLWHRLDDGSAWAEFVWESLSASFATTALEAMTKSSAIIVIDWTGHHAWTTTPFCGSNGNSNPPGKKTLVYMNFRVFSSGVKDEAKRKWYDEKECAAVQQADLVVALSEKDKASLLEMQPKDQEKSLTIHVLVPPLRNDMETLAAKHARGDTTTQFFLDHLPPDALKALNRAKDAGNAGKCFVTCVVRISPEKNTLRFVRFVKKMKSFFSERNWIPLLAGSESDGAYSKQVKRELTTVCGDDCVILDSFLPPESLAAVFGFAVLNFHPCSYDAYGMTTIEAAGMACPSIIAAGNCIGSSKHIGNGASIEVDFEDVHHIDQISGEAISKLRDTLEDSNLLDITGLEARNRALAWGEEAYGIALLDCIAKIRLHP